MFARDDIPVFQQVHHGFENGILQFKRPFHFTFLHNNHKILFYKNRLSAPIEADHTGQIRRDWRLQFSSTFKVTVLYTKRKEFFPIVFYNKTLIFDIGFCRSFQVIYAQQFLSSPAVPF
jgi:hypothetical protein